MPSAKWNGVVIAEATADSCEILEGHVYFPPSAIRKEYFQQSSKNTVCSWKGTTSYFDVVVGGKINPNAAWYYPAPREAAARIKGYIAFWQGVKVER